MPCLKRATRSVISAQPNPYSLERSCKEREGEGERGTHTHLLEIS